MSNQSGVKDGEFGARVRGLVYITRLLPVLYPAPSSEDSGTSASVPWHFHLSQADLDV